MSTTMNQHSPTIISKAAINKARRPPGRCSRTSAQIRPSASIDKDNRARRLICSRVGGGAFERFGTRSMGDDVVSGAPQPMHTVALSLTARPHSLHAISAMAILPNYAVNAVHKEVQRMSWCRGRFCTLTADSSKYSFIGSSFAMVRPKPLVPQRVTRNSACPYASLAPTHLSSPRFRRAQHRRIITYVLAWHDANVYLNKRVEELPACRARIFIMYSTIDSFRTSLSALALAACVLQLTSTTVRADATKEVDITGDSPLVITSGVSV